MTSLNLESEIKGEFKLLSNEFKNLSVKFLATLYQLILAAKKLVADYVESLNEFRWSNIQEWGFVNILIERAYRFFGLEDVEKRKVFKAKVKRGVKRYFKKFFKLLLFPLVLVIYVVYAFFEKKEDNNVKNSYKV